MGFAPCVKARAQIKGNMQDTPVLCCKMSLLPDLYVAFARAELSFADMVTSGLLDLQVPIPINNSGDLYQLTGGDDIILRLMLPTAKSIIAVNTPHVHDEYGQPLIMLQLWQCRENHFHRSCRKEKDGISHCGVNFKANALHGNMRHREKLEYLDRSAGLQIRMLHSTT